MERELYPSNGLLGLTPLMDDGESVQFHFSKLACDSKDFFNCETPIGLEYPDRSALQPICVHVECGDGSDGERADLNAELLDISSKRLPVDLGFNGLDRPTGQTNGNYTNIQANSLPTSESGSVESIEYTNLQYNDTYTRADYYTNQASPVDNDRVYYNNNHNPPFYSNQHHDQLHDHLNHHQSHPIYHRNHQPNHNVHHQNLHHLHHQNPHQNYNHNFHYQQSSTPLYYHQYLPQKKQQSFQRYRHRKHTPHDQPQKPPQSPLKITKLVKHKHKQKQQTLNQTQDQIGSPPQSQPKSQSKLQSKVQAKLQSKIQSKLKAKLQPPLKRKYHQRKLNKALEEKPVLNQRVVQKQKPGRPRKYNYIPPKPTKFRSKRLRLKVQSENLESEPESEGTPESEQKPDTKKEAKKEKEQEILPVEWSRPENLSFERETVSEFEKVSLPEFFAGKYDRTHFHPSQYLQIRNIFLDEWESRRPSTVRFREMIRVHKGIGNVVSFSRVCKFLTAIGAINDASQDDSITGNKEDDNSCNQSLPLVEDSQSKFQDDESEEPKEFLEPQSSSSPSPPSLSSSTEANALSLSATQSEDNLTQNVTPRPRKGRKRKSYFLNEMTRLGIDPLQAGFRMPKIEKDEESLETPDPDDKSNELEDLPETVQTSLQ